MLRTATVALTALFLVFPARPAEESPKQAAGVGPLLERAPRKNASSVPKPSPKAAAPSPLLFVIPRDTCQQGEPLQTLPLGKP